MCYFDNVFINPEATIQAICHTLNDPKFGRVDIIVGTGVSGALILIPASMASGIPSLYIRKRDDQKSHSTRRLEPRIPIDLQNKRYVIIDDTVESGSTIEFIEEEISYISYEATLAGVILYQEGFSAYAKNIIDEPLTCLKGDIFDIVNEGLSLV